MGLHFVTGYQIIDKSLGLTKSIGPGMIIGLRNPTIRQFWKQITIQHTEFLTLQAENSMQKCISKMKCLSLLFGKKLPKVRNILKERGAKWQCCGSGIRCLFDPGILDPGSGICFFWIPDLWSRIPNQYFESLVTIFWVKRSIIIWKLVQFFSSAFQKLNNFQFCEIYGYKKRYDI